MNTFPPHGHLHVGIRSITPVREDWGQLTIPTDEPSHFAHCIVTSPGAIEYAQYSDRIVYVLSGHGYAHVNGFSHELTTNDYVQVPRHHVFHVEPLHGSTVTLAIFNLHRPAP